MSYAHIGVNYFLALTFKVRRKTEVGDRIIFYKDKSCEVKPVDKEFRSMYVLVLTVYNTPRSCVQQ